jgi:hypothetical protein
VHCEDCGFHEHLEPHFCMLASFLVGSCEALKQVPRNSGWAGCRGCVGWRSCPHRDFSSRSTPTVDQSRR